MTYKERAQVFLEAMAKDRWDSYRQRHAIPADAPFIGNHPIDEALGELADAWNYIEVLSREPEWRAAGWPTFLEAARQRLIEATSDLLFIREATK